MGTSLGRGLKSVNRGVGEDMVQDFSRDVGWCVGLASAPGVWQGSVFLFICTVEGMCQPCHGIGRSICTTLR